MSEKPISPLRRRMIEDMSVRKFGEKTQHDYIRHIEAFAKFLGRSPDTATAEDLRRYQVHQSETGVQPPTVNSSAVALRFLFTVTLGRANLAAQLTRVHCPRRLPRVLSPRRKSGVSRNRPGPGLDLIGDATGGSRRNTRERRPFARHGDAVYGIDCPCYGRAVRADRLPRVFPPHILDRCEV